jgi:hypothetical protein
MAAKYQHFAAQENRLGRHYSRFRSSAAFPPLTSQQLGQRK